MKIENCSHPEYAILVNRKVSKNTYDEDVTTSKCTLCGSVGMYGKFFGQKWIRLNDFPERPKDWKLVKEKRPSK